MTPGTRHASCVARGGDGVLLLGPPGAGKSGLALRLIDRGFVLIADDRVVLEDGQARPPAELAGLLEIRGLGILRLPYQKAARLVLAVRLDQPPPAAQRLPDRLPGRLPGRLPDRGLRLPDLDLPTISLDARTPEAPLAISAALDVLAGITPLVAGDWQ